MNLGHLNEGQREAVLSTEGPLMILAGAGSGKTRTLVTKISYLIDQKEVSPFRVLALTFSNKAAKEMRDRIAMLTDAETGILRVMTFHSFCTGILRKEFQYIGLAKNFTIYDKSESRTIAKNLLKRRGVDMKEISPLDILYYIDGLKNGGYYLGREGYGGEVDETDTFYSYYLEYEEELHKANALDFGGLIVGVLELFEKYPKVLEGYCERFRYIMVDEYQDTNRAQFDLVKLLGGKQRNICVVGDEDQSIYSWRGADIRNILDFEEAFPDVRVVKLEQNYRSGANIIEAATHMIAQNIHRKGKNMWTQNPPGESLRIVECTSDREEADFIVGEIGRLRRDGIALREMAVFYRANAQSRIVEDFLRRNRVAYRIVGGIKFYDRKEIKDMIAYLRVVINEKDSLSLSRIINVPVRGIGATTLRKLEEVAIGSQISLWEAINDFVGNPSRYSHIRVSGKVASSLASFVSLIGKLRDQNRRGEHPSAIFHNAFFDSGYGDLLKVGRDVESRIRLENIEELGNAIGEYERMVATPTLSGFLEMVALDTENPDADARGSGNDQVSLMTIHGAKGLEFPYVFVAGVEENMLPSYKSLEEGDQESVEEERRLFYVAMTRAMKKLYLTFAQGRMVFGKIQYHGPSRFLSEIPEKYYIWNKMTSTKNPPVDAVSPRGDGGQGFDPGSRIVHSLYGEGLVLQVDGAGSDEKVLIRFKNGTRKKFMVKFAPLTKL